VCERSSPGHRPAEMWLAERVVRSGYVPPEKLVAQAMVPTADTMAVRHIGARNPASGGEPSLTPHRKGFDAIGSLQWTTLDPTAVFPRPDAPAPMYFARTERDLGTESASQATAGNAKTRLRNPSLQATVVFRTASNCIRWPGFLA